MDPLELSQALIRCPSVTPTDAGALDVLAGALEGLGFTCHRLPFTGDGSHEVQNLYARIGDDAPNFCFAGHTDVVPVGDAGNWSVDPFEALVKDGRLYGRGASDMKTAIAAFILSGIIFLVVAEAGLQAAMVIGLFTLAGLVQGILRPARDMMVRAMAPKGALGRVFGYVSTGIALGSAIAPVLFGFMVDQGLSVWIFWLLAVFSGVGILIVLVQKRGH